MRCIKGSNLCPANLAQGGTHRASTSGNRSAILRQQTATHAQGGTQGVSASGSEGVMGRQQQRPRTIKSCAGGQRIRQRRGGSGGRSSYIFLFSLSTVSAYDWGSSLYVEALATLGRKPFCLRLALLWYKGLESAINPSMMYVASSISQEMVLVLWMFLEALLAETGAWWGRRRHGRS